MTAWIVIPCYNEEKRFDADAVASLLVSPGVGVVLVDDGSTDGTWRRLDELARQHPDRIEALRLTENAGKGEAVRRGLIRGCDKGAEIVGYLDADFATPASEMRRLVDIFERSDDISILLGSRWQHLGVDIRRSRFRHYTGRVFATLASIALRLSVYDTQCGAKLFRVDDKLTHSVSVPFISRWVFDVELLGRLSQSGVGPDQMLEVPLEQWHDIKGSKISLLDMVRATLELIPISLELRRSQRHEQR